MEFYARFIEGSSCKDYRLVLDVDAATVTATWGRIGGPKQSKTHEFATDWGARGKYNQLIKEKLAKGYKEVVTDSYRVTAPARVAPAIRATVQPAVAAWQGAAESWSAPARPVESAKAPVKAQTPERSLLDLDDLDAYVAPKPVIEPDPRFSMLEIDPEPEPDARFSMLEIDDEPPAKTKAAPQPRMPVVVVPRISFPEAANSAADILDAQIQAYLNRGQAVPYDLITRRRAMRSR